MKNKILFLIAGYEVFDLRFFGFDSLEAFYILVFVSGK